MEHYHYERLSAQDNDFLQWETPALPMHGSAILILEAGPLRTPEGGIDFAALKQGYASVLHHLPRYRQKLLWPAGEDRAIWVDDAQFNLDYHMRHIALPRPGSEAQLKRLAADVMERPMDRGSPLWETWVVERLEGDRFALVTKTHHCMVDGSSGMGLLGRLFSTTPEYEIHETPRFVPRPAPSEGELRRDAVRRLADLPGRALRELQDFVSETDHPADEIGRRVGALWELAGQKLRRASDTPINGPIGPHRIFDWLDLSLADFKAVRRANGCSVNDVVLATVTGAVRELMTLRQLRPEELDFRVSAPVNARSAADSEKLGNHVSSWIVSLPLDRADPLEQLEAIQHTTQALKESNQAAGIEMVMALHEWIPFDIQAASNGTQNMLVTNVPGPPFPLYMMGAELKSLLAQAPLIENIGLAVSVLSYNGKMGFGFNADYDKLPDLARFVEAMDRSFARLAELSGVERESRAAEPAIEEKPAAASRKRAKRKRPARASAQAAGHATTTHAVTAHGAEAPDGDSKAKVGTTSDPVSP
jgi:WS/DGAT/MGAT family acyltransferase